MYSSLPSQPFRRPLSEYCQNELCPHESGFRVRRICLFQPTGKVLFPAGQTPILYATQRSYRMYLEGAFDEYPLWLRDVYLWPALTLPGRDWTFWQYSDKGRLEGYEGEEEYIDFNVFGGGEDDLARWLERA